METQQKAPLDYASLQPELARATRVSHVALILGLISAGMFMVTAGTMLMYIIVPPFMIKLLAMVAIGCALGALSAGVLGLRDARRTGRGIDHSWVGIGIGGGLIVQLLGFVLLAIFWLNKY